MDQHLPICLINKELSHNIESWNQFVNYWSSGSCQGGDKPQTLTMAGYDISSESMQNKVEQTWNHKAEENLLFALFKRHFASRLSPDPIIVDDFKEYCGKRLKKLVKDINKLPLPDFITVDDWL